MTLTTETVAKMAHLARLELTPEQLEAYRGQLTAILDFAALLNTLDLDGVPPTAHAVAQHNVLRPDVVAPSLPLEDALFNAAQTAVDQFLIQAVLDD